MHKEIQDIPLEFFPIWGSTLDYERGLPHFRQPPEFAEEGELVLTGGKYTYYPVRRYLMTPSSQLSPTGQVELERSPSMTLPPSRNEHEMDNVSHPASRQQTPEASAHSTYDQVCSQPYDEGSFCDVDIPFNHDCPQRAVCGQRYGEGSSCDADIPFNHDCPQRAVCGQRYCEGSSCDADIPFNHDCPQRAVCGEDWYGSLMYGNPVEHGEAEEQTYLQTIFASSMDASFGSTSVPRSMQYDQRDPVSPYYSQAQNSLGHNWPMTSPQPDVQMADLFGYGPL